MTLEGSLSTESRLAWLRDELGRTGRVSLALSAESLQVSEMTVRRDLATLEKLGDARRVRGGAVAVRPAQFADRRRSHSRAKARIAEKLRHLLPAHGAVALDGSSTVLGLVPFMSVSTGLLVITNGPDTFASLTAQRGVTAVITGGQLDEHGTGSLVGPLAVHNAREIATSRMFCSALGLTEVGTTEHCLDEAQVKQTFGEFAGEIILAVDSSKVGVRGVAKGFDWSRIALLATELAPEHSKLAPYRDLVEVI